MLKRILCALLALLVALPVAGGLAEDAPGNRLGLELLAALGQCGLWRRE